MRGFAHVESHTRPDHGFGFGGGVVGHHAHADSGAGHGAGRTRYLARRPRDRVRLRRRHLDGAGRAAATRACWCRTRPRDRARSTRPTGAALAFVSTRTGGGDIYLLTLWRRGDGDAPHVRRWTEQLDGWSRDGAWIYFSSTTPRHRRHERRVPRAASTAARRCRSPTSATPTSFSARRHPTAGRSRSARAAFRRASGGAMAAATSTNRRSGSRSPAPRRPTARIVDRGAKATVADVGGRRRVAVLHVRSQRQREHLAGAARRAQARAVTRFTKGRVLWPSITTDGKTDRVRARLRLLDGRDRERHDEAR